MNRREYIKNTTLALGYVISATAITEILASCQASENINWEPVFFNHHQAATIAEIAETICPKTTTPGAKDLAIPQFIDKVVKQLFNADEQKIYIDGLKELDTICQKKYSKNFKDCNNSIKETELIELDKNSPPFQLTQWGKPLEANPKPLTFYRRIKGLVLMAYFTNEKIGKEFLVYDPVPGDFIPCMPLQSQNAWTE
jgi:Gluconate 2-dehydrogenase subunit 3